MWAIALASFRRFGINRIASDTIMWSQKSTASPTTTDEAERQIKKNMEVWHNLWKREQKDGKKRRRGKSR